MSDAFNELGKYLYKQRRDSELATKRTPPRPPVVERDADVFDSFFPFDMEFKTHAKQSVTLDLIFKSADPTPPTSSAPTGCSGCYCVICEGGRVISETITDDTDPNPPPPQPDPPPPPVVGDAELPIGGDESLRGARTFTLQTADATASGGSVASFNTARNSAGVGGTVRISASISGTLVCNVANQLIQCDPGVTITGRVDFNASGITWEGGIINGGFYTPRITANNITIRNFYCNNGSFANNCISIEGKHDNWLISQFNMLNAGDTFIRAWYDQPGDGDPNGMRIEHGILIRNAAWGTRASHGFFGASRPSVISGGDGNGTNAQRNFVVHNCRIDNGTIDQGGMGIEWWNHESSGTASGRGGIIQYCDLRGGEDFLISDVRSRDNWTHHNIMRLGPAYACYEAAGPTHIRGVFEWNYIIASSPNTGAGIYHNNGATGMQIVNNKFENVAWFVDGCCNGGGYNAHDNCRIGSTSGVFSGSFPVPNTDINNVSGCGQGTTAPPINSGGGSSLPTGGSNYPEGGSFSNRVIQLSYPYVQDSVYVIVNGQPTTSFTQSDPDNGIITLTTSGTFIRICYVRQIEGC